MVETRASKARKEEDIPPIHHQSDDAVSDSGNALESNPIPSEPEEDIEHLPDDSESETDGDNGSHTPRARQDGTDDSLLPYGDLNIPFGESVTMRQLVLCRLLESPRIYDDPVVFGQEGEDEGEDEDDHEETEKGGDTSGIDREGEHDESHDDLEDSGNSTKRFLFAQMVAGTQDTAGTSATPGSYRSYSLSGTKDISNKAYALPRTRQCKRIVVALNMMGDLMADVERKLEADELRISTHTRQGMEALTAIWPQYTSRGLPQTINSEKDVEDFEAAIKMRPALHVLMAHKSKSLEDQRKGMEPCAKVPYFCSAVAKGNAIADAVLKDGADGDKIKLRVEVKVDKVLLQLPRQSGDVPTIFDPLYQASDEVFEFRWPTEKKTAAIERNRVGFSRLTRIVVQVWEQLLKTADDTDDPDGGNGILTTYDKTIFLVRRNDTLFLSPVFKTSERVLLAYTAFLFKIFHETDKNFTLPNVRYRRRRRVQVGQTRGIDATLFKIRNTKNLKHE